MSIEVFPQTSLGSAAAAVVDKLAARRSASIKTWTGAKIAEAGIWDMPIEAYHSDCCEGPSISSSGMRMFEAQDGCPAKYWATSYLNPNRVGREEKDHFTFGSAAHTLLLGEGLFWEKFIIRPDKAPDGRAWNGNNETCRKWLAAQRAAGLAVITQKDLDHIKGMSKSLERHPLIEAGLLNGEVERSLIWKDKETGIWLKARPDALPVHADVVADIKTCADASARGVRESIIGYGYHMQMALVGMGMKEVMDRELGNDDLVLVFVEKTPPYLVNVKPIDAEAIYWGRLQIRRALRKFAACIASGEWPGYADDGATFTLPDFMIKRLASEQNMGLLPTEDAA